MRSLNIGLRSFVPTYPILILSSLTNFLLSRSDRSDSTKYLSTWPRMLSLNCMYFYLGTNKSHHTVIPSHLNLDPLFPLPCPTPQAYNHGIQLQMHKTSSTMATVMLARLLGPASSLLEGQACRGVLAWRPNTSSS